MQSPMSIIQQHLQIMQNTSATDYKQLINTIK